MAEGNDKMEPEGGVSQSGDDEEPSPAASPRDKKTRLERPGDSPRLDSSRKPTARELLVAASPPKFINVEDVMRLANGVTDMALAHEIAVSHDFRIEAMAPDPASLEGRVKEVMHKAFWDVLAASLAEDPPDYTHALVLLKEVKQGLSDLLLPHHQRLRVAIDEVLDLALIEQQAENGVLDFLRYAKFIVDTMAMLCAPVRDQLIASLRNRTDIVTLYREILEALSLMKLDMVNFTITHFRPYFQQHSVDYERKKFQTMLDVQKENGIDGLQFCRSWLIRSAERVLSRSAEQTAGAEKQPAGVGVCPAEGASSSSASEVPLSGQASAVLNAAYVEVLNWDDEHQVFPETLLIDRQRFMDLRDKVRWLTLVTSVLLVTYSTVGAAIAGLAELKKKLTSQIGVLTNQVPQSKLAETMVNVAEQVNSEVNRSLGEHGFPVMKPEQEQLLKGQIVAVVEPDNGVYRLMSGRLMTFIEKVLSNPGVKDVQLPPGFSAVSEELSGVVGQFLRLVTYNQAVFGSYYSEIISSALSGKQHSRPEQPSTPTTST